MILNMNFTDEPVDTTGNYLDHTLSQEKEFISIIVVEKLYKIIITILGLLGNGLTILILSKKHNRKSSTAVYLNALAISDIFIVISGPFGDWLEAVSEVSASDVGDIVCKVQTFVQYSSSSTSSWLLVAVTIERTISVTIPHRVRTSCTMRLAVIIVIVIWALLYATNIHFLFGMGHTYNKLCKATSSQSYIKFSLMIFPWIDFCLCFAFPGLLILAGNTAIIYQLAQYHTRQKKHARGPYRRNISISLVLVTINFAFLAMSGPMYFFIILIPYFRETTSTETYYSLQEFWGPIFNGLWETNAALNIILYVLSGSKFRQELWNILCCRQYKKTAHGVFETKTPINRIYIKSPFRRSQSHYTMDDHPSENCINLIPMPSNGQV